MSANDRGPGSIDRQTEKNENRVIEALRELGVDVQKLDASLFLGWIVLCASASRHFVMRNFRVPATLTLFPVMRNELLTGWEV